ncbi:hypothetical protein ACTVLM_25175, partial [Serratia marcescens]|uniref:hypothetical protein n=1 Tax=Serratia marcescens TaxID=615 RepID=UPI003FA759B4
DITLKMPTFEWVHVLLRQQKVAISLSPPDFCNSAMLRICGFRLAPVSLNSIPRWTVILTG